MASLCTVTTLRASLEDTLLFARYHVNSGVDRVLLFFDDPADPAADQLDGADRVTCVRCDRAHWAASGLPENPSVEQKQLYNAGLGLAAARAEGLGWIAHIDNDELLYARRGLAATLDAVDARYVVVKFRAMEAVPRRTDHAQPFTDIDTFRTTPGRRSATRLAEKLCGRVFFEGEYFRGYKSAKSAVRTGADVTAMGLHWPHVGGTDDYPRATAEDAGVLHFDSCTYDVWKRKSARRVSGEATQTTLRKNRYRQLDVFAQCQGDEGKLRALFERLYLVPAYERFVLARLGMLTTVRLDPRLFAPLAAEQPSAIPS